jgi:stage II sporulation protein D
MKKMITAVLTVLLGVAQANPQDTDFSQKQKPATIKVLIQRKAPDSLIEVKGRYQIFNPVDGTQITSGIMSKRYAIAADEYGMKWGEKFPGIHQIRIVPGDSQSSILVNGIQYKGVIEVYEIDGKINVVNEVDIENFLRSTLTAQFPNFVEEEVMSAIAVVARTNAYYVASKNKNAFWHIEAEEARYQGNALVASKVHVDRAIETTRHAIMTFQNTPFAATWTKNSAGKTADFASIFRKSIATPPGVQAPLAAKDREQHKWSFAVPKQALAKSANMGGILAADLYLAHNSDKVYAIKLSNESESADVDFFTLQKMVGASKLKSNDFTVAVKDDQIIFTGYGEGPGVGLCLYSARTMAEKGEKAPKILTAFFPNTQIEKVRTLEQFKY